MFVPYRIRYIFFSLEQRFVRAFVRYSIKCFMNKDYPSSFVLASRLLVLFLVIALAYFLQGVLVPVLFAIIFAITLYPLCCLLERWKLPRAAASIISVVVATLTVSGILYFIVNQVIVIGKNGEDISKNFVNIYDSIQS